MTKSYNSSNNHKPHTNGVRVGGFDEGGGGFVGHGGGGVSDGFVEYGP